MSNANVTYSIHAEQDDQPVRGHFVSDEPELDRELEESILRRLDRGYIWAWASVRVTASITIDGVTFEGHDYLGGCSYKSEADFREPGGYFDDMKVEALADLRRTLMDAAKRGDVAIRALEMVTP
jgi:hypothetical protein